MYEGKVRWQIEWHHQTHYYYCSSGSEYKSSKGNNYFHSIRDYSSPAVIPAFLDARGGVLPSHQRVEEAMFTKAGSRRVIIFSKEACRSQVNLPNMLKLELLCL